MNTTDSFSKNYANIYDLFHSNKNYGEEVLGIFNLLGSEYFDTQPKTILDFGCGTGLHLEKFANLGFYVAGFDISKSMLGLASRRVPSGNFYHVLEQIPEGFGLTVSLFDVLSYQTSWKQFQEMFRALKSKTSFNGAIVVDSWNLEGVRLDPPRISKRSVEFEGNTYTSEVSPIRVIRPLDSDDGLIYELLVRVVDETNKQLVAEENHKIRAWSIQDIEKIAKEAELKVLKKFNPKNFSNSEAADWRFGVILQNGV